MCVGRESERLNLPRLAVAQSHPNPRRSVRPSGVDRAWELPSEHKRQIVVSRSPFAPPSLFPHHHLLLPPLARTSFFTHFPLVETHGSHQGMITLLHLLQTHN